MSEPRDIKCLSDIERKGSAMHGWDRAKRLSMQLSLPGMSYYSFNIVTSSTKLQKTNMVFELCTEPPCQIYNTTW